MILSMTPLTFFHVLISLIGILTGIIALLGMIAGKRLDGWTPVFLVTTALTSITPSFSHSTNCCHLTFSGSFCCSCWRLRSLHATSSTSKARGARYTRSPLRLRFG